MRKKVKANPIPTRKPFAIELINKISELKIGQVSSGMLSDNSAFWVQVKIKNKILSFSFDADYNTLNDVGMYKEIKEVVGQKRIFGK